ncbi:hypothetical protein C1I92_08270 [Jiangella anatolica]|uniref:Uncharacterized protein n=1 Tax=Jiangella anatolica TaxID=2670374 RepID=A0A2W2BW45_9ACTN|nr:hypothetical protein C1I92_08270 [Jiangella anatolica]
MASALRSAAERETPFAAVVVLTAAGPAPRGKEALARVRLLRQVRPGLSRWCRGLAFVLPDNAPGEVAQRKSGDRLWGCPTLATRDVERARDWARRALAGDA